MKTVLIFIAFLPAICASAQEYPFVDWSARGVPRNAVNALAQDHRGFVWVGTEHHGLLRLDGRHVRAMPASEQRISQRITALAADGAGTLFAGTDAGLTAIRLGPDAQDAVDTVLTALLTGIRGPVYHLRMSASRLLHVETASGAWDVNLRDSSIVSARSTPPPWDFLRDVLPGFVLRGMAKDCIGQYWLATDRGLLLKGDGMEYVFDTSKGLPVQDLRSVLVDREMNVWCGSASGLFMHTPGRATWLTGGKPLPEDCGGVQCMLESERGLWFGTSRGGCMRLFGGDRLLLTTAEGLPSNRVTAMLELPSGELLIGTDSGLVISDGQRAAPAPAGMHAAGRSITALMRASDRSYWIASETGLLRWSRTADTFAVRSGELPSRHVLALAEDAFGFVWVGTRAGVVRLSAEEGDVHSIPELQGMPVTALHRDRKDRIWIGTRGAGVFVRSEGKLMRLGQRDGLGSDFITGIGEDNFGALYFGTTRGVTVLPRKNMQYVIPVDSARQVIRGIPPAHVPYLRSEAMYALPAVIGLSHGGLSRGAVLRTRSGFLWFGAREGALRYVPSSPAEIGDWRPPPCRALRQPGAPLRFDVMLSELCIDDTCTELSDVIELAYGAHVLRADVITPSFRNPDATCWLYTMQGLERAWHVSRDGSILYSGLPPGRYVLSLQAGLGEGIWSKRQDVLTIVVRRPFYLSVWFWAVLLLFAGLIGFMLKKHTHERQLARLRAGGRRQ